MNEFSITAQSIDEIRVFAVNGYFGWDSGKQLQTLVDKDLGQGIKHFIFELSNCQMISSPGIVSILNVITKVRDEFHGNIVLAQLDQVLATVMKVSGVMNLATASNSLAEAVELIRNSSQNLPPEANAS
ncbi:MAG: STAS domain-containing protein [Candidatus Riflebacteria bacterium]|nr:STAS domain-containing protein [Candidatus Riflebacteria bacterium]